MYKFTCNIYDTKKKQNEILHNIIISRQIIWIIKIKKYILVNFFIICKIIYIQKIYNFKLNIK